MEQSKKPIKDHLQDFIDFCEVEKGLKKNTQENYKKYLEKFFNWMSLTQNSSLLPHQLTSDHIWAYRLYLSREPSPATGKLLSKGTQNYYLIALRAFLGYFVAKDILSLPPDKISLPKPDKSQKSVKFLTLEQIGKLLASVEPKNNIGIRDRANLKPFFSTDCVMQSFVSFS
jgi:site-specific recombinase XerD